MKTKMFLYLISLFLLILTSTNIIAQHQGDNARNQQDRRQKIETYKIGFITEKLNLTPQEAQKFWPVYNEFEAKKQGLHKSMAGKYKDYRLSKEATEKQATELIDSSLNVMQANLTLARDYYGKLKTILPPQKIVALFNAERQFRRELLQRLADRNNRNRHDKE
jgi:hypothetical protein